MAGRAETPYKVLESIGSGIEIREYPSQVWARTMGDQKEAFQALYEYISGYNKTMEKIVMAAPVIIFNSNEGRVMAFIMPHGRNLRSLPKSLTERVKLEAVAPRKVAAIAFSGIVTPDSFDRGLRLIQETLKKRGTGWIEPAYLLQYDDPNTPPFLRRNEVAVQLKS
ncbi:MAG: heme-binding protein [Methanotrichaceae archaeon]